MGSGKRASMREGPLANLFRKTETDGLEPPRAEEPQMPERATPTPQETDPYGSDPYGQDFPPGQSQGTAPSPGGQDPDPPVTQAS